MSSNPIRDLNQIYINEVSADTALAASKAADKKRGQLASAGDKEGAAAKAQQASRLYKASAEKRKSEPAKQPDRSYPKGKGANYKEDKDWGYDKDGNSLNPVDIEKRKKKDDDLAGSPNVKKESYETKKKAEVLSAMKRQGRKLSDKDKEKIANKVVTSKGDTSKSDDRYAYEELNQVRKLVEKVLTPGAKLAKLRADDELFGAPKKPWNKVRKVTDQETSQKVRDRQGKWKNEEVENDSGMEHNLEVLGMLSEKEVKVKDTKKVVDAIRAYDKSKDASRDATADTDEGDEEKADIEKKYAAKERGEIDKDDPNWKKRKYHTGIHGEEVEALKRLVESGKFSDEEIETMAWDVYEGLVKPAGTSDASVDKATRKAATRKFGNTTPPKAKIPEGYQRNPEEGERKEREANKKYERVRGERTPMPPRGNKRREDFEKWYAANVR